MRRIATSIMLLAVLAAPAFAAQQLDEIAPLLAGPQLSFDPAPDTGWVAESWKPELFTIGLARTVQGSLEPEVPVIAQRAASGNETGGMARSVDAREFRGQRIRLSARLKSQDAGRLQMWVRVYSAHTYAIQYDMSERPISGTSDWRSHDIVMDMPADANSLHYGFFLSGSTSLFGPRDGKGIAWGDSFTIEMVDKKVPVSIAYLAADYRSPPPQKLRNSLCTAWPNAWRNSVSGTGSWGCVKKDMYSFDTLGRAPR